jgi:hypothetical protein
MRNIWFASEFDAAVARLGGYHLVDEALEPIMDGLYRNRGDLSISRTIGFR